MTVGDWIVFHGIDHNGEEDQYQPLWLGRVLSNADWGGQGVLQNTTSRTTKYKMGIEVKRNEVAIFVQWYEKIDLFSDELKYHVSREVTLPQVQNNQLLLHSTIQMTQLRGDNNPVPRNRTGSSRQTRATRSTATDLGDYEPPRQNNQSTYERWHDKEFGIIWEMSEEDRDYALGLSRREP